MKKVILSIFILIIIALGATSKNIAQNMTLNFSAIDIGKGKVKISWNNYYKTCTQLSVQQSFDSLKKFQTIFTTQSPTLPQNGFIYNVGTGTAKVFYRIFYVLNEENYFFSESKSAIKFIEQKEQIVQPTSIIPAEIKIEDISFLSKKRRINSDIITAENLLVIVKQPTEKVKLLEKKFINIYKRKKDSLIATFEYTAYTKFKDSIATKTKDTLYAINRYDVILMPFIPKYIWKPSLYLFTNVQGYVSINLLQVKQHHYRVVFWEEDGSFLFEIKHVKEPELILDKTNFIHAGWFNFELFEDEKLKEKNKVYVEK